MSFNFMAAVTIHSDFWSPPKIKSVTVSTFSPSICHGVMGLGAMILVSLMLNFKPVVVVFGGGRGVYFFVYQTFVFTL